MNNNNVRDSSSATTSNQKNIHEDTINQWKQWHLEVQTSKAVAKKAENLKEDCGKQIVKLLCDAQKIINDHINHVHEIKNVTSKNDIPLPAANNQVNEIVTNESLKLLVLWRMFMKEVGKKRKISEDRNKLFIELSNKMCGFTNDLKGLWEETTNRYENSNTTGNNKTEKNQPEPQPHCSSASNCAYNKKTVNNQSEQLPTRNKTEDTNDIEIEILPQVKTETIDISDNESETVYLSPSKIIQENKNEVFKNDSHENTVNKESANDFTGQVQVLKNWQLVDEPKSIPYVPQIDDHIVYFRQRHENFLNIVESNKLFMIDESKDKPWTSMNINDKEFVYVKHISYNQPHLGLCNLELVRFEDNTLSKKTFSVRYCVIEGVDNFLMLHQTYDKTKGTVYVPKSDEWPSKGREATCHVILQNLEMLDQKLKEEFQSILIKPFFELRDDPYYLNEAAYPIDLTVIRTRLKNHFYRRLSALEFDIDYLNMNIKNVNRSNVKLHTNSKKFKSLLNSFDLMYTILMEIIQKSEEIDIKLLYRRLVHCHDSIKPTVDAQSSNKPEKANCSQTESCPTDLGLKSRKRRMVTLNWYTECNQLLNDLWADKTSKPLRYPVNLTKYPDCLQTVKERHTDLYYANPKQFDHDMSWIFKNCKKYKQSVVYEQIEKLENIYRNRIEEIITHWQNTKKKRCNSTNANNDQKIESDGVFARTRKVDISFAPCFKKDKL